MTRTNGARNEASKFADDHEELEVYQFEQKTLKVNLGEAGFYPTGHTNRNGYCKACLKVMVETRPVVGLELEEGIQKANSRPHRVATTEELAFMRQLRSQQCKEKRMRVADYVLAVTKQSRIHINVIMDAFKLTRAPIFKAVLEFAPSIYFKRGYFYVPSIQRYDEKEKEWVIVQ